MIDLPRMQFAALPFRMNKGAPEVMLITSRDTGRWIIPKGWPVRRFAPAVAAAREAYEEAGLIGQVSKRPIGHYLYDKKLSALTSVRCEVQVFLLEVEQELHEWPEQNDRGRCWLPPTQAVHCVTESGLQEILLSLTPRLDAWRKSKRQRLSVGVKTLSGANGRKKDVRSGNRRHLSKR